MEDYKEMYFALFRAVEDAIGLLIKAQRACEERFLNGGDEKTEAETEEEAEEVAP